ncbi:Uncharacterised protein [Segatella copri]|nr:Uncharacterised protein [Segatella copri]
MPRNWQLVTITFFTLLMQMPSSPTSKVEFTMREFLQDSRSRPSPFCAKEGLRTNTSSINTFSHING